MLTHTNLSDDLILSIYITHPLFIGILSNFKKVRNPFAFKTNNTTSPFWIAASQPIDC